MLTLPDAIVAVLVPFAKLFTNPTWRKAQVLVVGAILTPGQRTVTAALRVMGRSDQRDYARLPRGAQPGGLVASSGGPHPANAAAPAPRPRRRPSGLRYRRDPGTTSRSQDQGSRHLPGRGAFQSPPTGQGQRPVMGLPDVVGPGTLGRSALCPAGAAPPTAGTPAQETHRLGQADDTATASMAAATRAGAGGRQRLRCAGPAPPLLVPPGTRHPDRPFAHGRRPAPARQPGQNGRPPLKGARRPSLQTLLHQPQTTWARAAVAWYDGAAKTVELTSRTAVWHRSGKPPVPIRWALIRDPQGSFAPQTPLCTDPDPAMVCAPLATGRRLSGGSNTPGRRDPASVVRPGHRTHHSGPAGSLLLDHPGRTRLAEPPPHAPAHRGLVRQAVADLRGCHRPGEAPPVACVGGFFTVGPRPRYSGTPRRPVPPTCGLSRLRSLNCVKSSLAPSH